MHQVVPPSSQPVQRNVQREATASAPLPAQLLDTCTVCFEEQLYLQGLSLLSSTLTAGTGTQRPSYVPLTQHLAFVATLSVHPSFNTRTMSKDKQRASDEASRYLKQASDLVGTRSAGFEKAFQFSEHAGNSRNRRARTRQSDVASDDEDDQSIRIKSRYFDKDSLWTNASDFWAVVGWAFNCSVAHKHRWQRWQLWLDLMLDVLNDDLDQRIPEAMQYRTDGDFVAAENVLNASMLATYLETIGDGRNNKRRVMRAILANGKAKSLAEFTEIWRNEARPPKQKKEEERAAKRRKLDFERGEFGDYLDNDSEEESPLNSNRQSRASTKAPSTRASRAPSGGESEDGEDAEAGSATPKGTPTITGVEAFGGMDSIYLRQRCLALLVRFCAEYPDAFLDTEDLFDLYTEFLKPLSLPVFQQFVLPTKRWLSENSQASLLQMLLRPMLAAVAPPYDENNLTQADFESHYAYYAANVTSVVDNAKVSLLIEGLQTLLWKSRQLTHTSRLQTLIGRGIAARKEKAGLDSRRRTGANAKEGGVASLTLECSGERMLTILDMIREDDGNGTPRAVLSHHQTDGSSDSPLSELPSSQSLNDPTPYCFCQRASFGDMVGCDNERCEYQWFHWKCVGLTKEPSGQWLCPDCKELPQSGLAISNGP